MNVTIRKFVVGFLALAALVGVYVLYTQTNRTPPLVVNLAETTPLPVAEVNESEPGEVGTVLGIGIDRVERTEFLHRNERNEVDRVFGFEQLLHKEGSQWEITNPYMKLLLPTVQCIVTANRGKVQVETVFSRPMASDALFSGNVVIHILPAEPNNALECFIHLDDVGFLAAQSLFSSEGAVRFLSRRAQLTGTGMELIYDEARARLELFRIFDLGSLRLQSRELGSVADLKPQPGRAAPAPDIQTGPKPAPEQTDLRSHDRYQCILHKNVMIAMPDRIVSARDELAIDNILGSSSNRRDVLARPAVDTGDANTVPYPGPNALDTTASSHTAISLIPPESFDTVITCDGGFEVTPMDSTLKLAAGKQKMAAARQKAKDDTPSPLLGPASSGTPERQRATARRIHFNALTRDTTLDGPVALAFPLDPNGLRGAKPAANAMPMTITAGKAVRFLPANNQVLFEGGCEVTLSRSEPNLTYEYILTAPRLVLDLDSDPNKAKSGTIDVRKFATDGGPAALRILRKVSDKPVGGTELDAVQLQYETDPPAPGAAPARGGRFTAVGPGAIWIRNNETIDAKADPNQFSLARPCIARLTNFDRLTYSMATNRIVAEDESQQLQLDYFPLTDGKYTRYTRTIAGHVEAALKEIAKGRLELATLTATNGIEYEDVTGGQSFVGSTLSYDCAQSLVAVRGDAEQPCLLNGAQVDQIDLNLKTGRIQAEVSASSVLQVQP